MEKTLALCCELIRRPSVTPEDAGCQALMIEYLREMEIDSHKYTPQHIDRDLVLSPPPLKINVKEMLAGQQKDQD